MGAIYGEQRGGSNRRQLSTHPKGMSAGLELDARDTHNNEMGRR